MKNLILRNTDSTCKVVYKTNLLNDTDENFTVLTVEGLNNVEETFGLQFKQLQYNMTSFKAFAADNNLILESQTQDTTATIATATALSITTGTSLTAGTHSVAYTKTLASTGGNGTKTWSLASGTLPTGVTLGATTCILSGTPNSGSAGSYSFSITVTDTFTSYTKAFTLVIA